MPLQITSSARVKSEFVILAVFGEQNRGKSMLIPTAPKPLWLLTEATSVQSLTSENIEKVYGKPPTKEEIAAAIKEAEPSIKKDKLDKEVAAAMADLPGFTGITWDVPKVDVFSYAALKEAVDFVKSPAGKPYETIILDSASAANYMVQEFHLSKKTKAGNQVDGRLASKKAQDETYQFFCDLIAIPKNWVFLFQAEDQFTEIGTGDDKIVQRDLVPLLYGNKLKRNFKHLFRNMFQIKDGGKDDAGIPRRYLQTAAETVYGVERCISPRIAPQEPTNLTDIFDKLKGA